MHIVYTKRVSICVMCIVWNVLVIVVAIIIVVVVVVAVVWYIVILRIT